MIVVGLAAIALAIILLVVAVKVALFLLPFVIIGVLVIYCCDGAKDSAKNQNGKSGKGTSVVESGGKSGGAVDFGVQNIEGEDDRFWVFHEDAGLDNEHLHIPLRNGMYNPSDA